MVKFSCTVFALLVVACHAYPAAHPNVVGFTSRTVYAPGMQHPMTYQVEYAVPNNYESNNYYAGYYPQPMPAHERQRRQIGLGGMGGGMAGAGAQAQAQSQSLGAGMGMGGMGMGYPYMMGMPFMG